VSCSTIHYRFENDPNGVDESYWQNFALLEMVNLSGDVQTRKACPDGVHQITTKRTFIQSLIAGFPWIGWLAIAPRYVKVECGEKLASNGGGNSNVNNSNNTNNQTININIGPDMMKKKKRRKKIKKKRSDDE
jgi:hypothetical protein